jgi:hypothetical protein
MADIAKAGMRNKIDVSELAQAIWMQRIRALCAEELARSGAVCLIVLLGQDTGWRSFHEKSSGSHHVYPAPLLHAEINMYDAAVSD